MHLFLFLHSKFIFDCDFCVFFSQLCLKLDHHPLISTQAAKEQTVCVFLWSCCKTNCLRLILVWNGSWASFLLSCWSFQVRLSSVTAPSTAQNKHRRAHTEKKKPPQQIQFFLLSGARLCKECGQKEQETKLRLCSCFVPTCMFVVGRGLWPLCAAALLEEEGGSFDHKEALTEAEREEGVK